jgi:hypothetical protein
MMHELLESAITYPGVSIYSVSNHLRVAWSLSSVATPSGVPERELVALDSAAGWRSRVAGLRLKVNPVSTSGITGNTRRFLTSARASSLNSALSKKSERVLLWRAAPKHRSVVNSLE